MRFQRFSPVRLSVNTFTARQSQAGAGLVEAVVVLPLFFFIVLAVMQAALVFHAKSNVNYATFEAARAGSVDHARVAAIEAAFKKAMLPYYGGGRTLGELAVAAVKVAADLSVAAVRIEILSPTQESLTDYASPALQAALETDESVIPNVGLDELVCPRDVPGCKSDPASNASGQTLSDANLLKLRITYGIPPAKQMPVVGRFYTWALDKTGAAAADPFQQALVAARRIPVVTHTVMRMQSDPIRNVAMASLPGPGNGGAPADPGLPPIEPLPVCPIVDPTCSGGVAGGGGPPIEEPPCL